jgi:hypothetical protein
MLRRHLVVGQLAEPADGRRRSAQKTTASRPP